MALPLILAVASAALAGFLGTVVLTSLLGCCVEGCDLYDQPTEVRKIHTDAMPTGGGLAIAGGAIAGILTFVGVQGLLPGPMQTIPFWAGALLMLGTGFWDDVHGVDPKGKFVLQLVAAYLLLHAGIHLDLAGFSFAPEDGFTLALYSIPFSMLWVVGIINAVNLIDGLDGLASGVIAIAFLACAALFGVKGELEAMAVGVVLVGAIGGFLPYNFNPASIFMGDSGSLFLGYLLAGYTLQAPVHSDPALSLLILPVLLGVPVLDTGAAIIRRWGSDRAVFAPDNKHIHHQLVSTDSETTAVLVLYGVGAWFGSAALLMGVLPVAWGYILAVGTAIVAFAWAWQLGCLTPVPATEQSVETKEPSIETEPPAGLRAGGDGFGMPSDEDATEEERTDSERPLVRP